jgi:Papain family cysteine protease
MPSKKGFGWKPDPPSTHDLDILGWNLRTEALPSKFSMREHVKQVMNQESTSSCVAHAFSQALQTAERALGVQRERPSPLFIYFNARRMDALSSFIVSDNGTYLRAAAQGLQKLGAPDEEYWPFSTGVIKVNRRPNFEAYMRGHPRRGGEYRRIFANGSARVLAIKAALFSLTPVAFGTNVAESFLDPNGPSLIDLPHVNEPIAGGHAMCIVGWENTDVGTVFEVCNSWDKDWRDAGFWYMTEAYATSPQTSDLWAVRGWEAVREDAIV